VHHSIGRSDPISLYVTTHQTGLLPDEKLTHFIQKNINLSQEAICDALQLNRPIYRPTATYGHFGRLPFENGCFSWERLTLVNQFKKLMAQI
jgi:S-adenosylmethionine synthetase